MSSPGTTAPPLEAVTVDAFRRADRGVGVRNHVLVVPSVICSHIVADRIAESTDEAVSTPHDHGCAQIGADHEQTERALLNLGQNPNVAGVTVVGLGCEHLQSGPFADRIADADVPVRETSIQDAGGSDACIEEGIKATEELADEAATVDATGTSLSEITVGVVSSDIATSTRDVADPLVGEVVDALLDAGARVALTGTERLAAHADAAAARGADDKVAAAMRSTTKRGEGQPGNVRGVVRRAAENSFDDVTGFWGEGDIKEVVPYGGQPSVNEGLVFVDAPSRFEEAATALAAVGASIVIHITSEGIPTGHPVVPVLKVTGDESTAEALANDVDIDARSTTPGGVLDELRRVADGEPTAAERHGLTKFAINRVGPSL